MSLIKYSLYLIVGIILGWILGAQLGVLIGITGGLAMYAVDQLVSLNQKVTAVLDHLEKSQK